MIDINNISIGTKLKRKDNGSIGEVVSLDKERGIVYIVYEAGDGVTRNLYTMQYLNDNFEILKKVDAENMANKNMKKEYLKIGDTFKKKSDTHLVKLVAIILSTDTIRVEYSDGNISDLCTDFFIEKFEKVDTEDNMAATDKVSEKSSGPDNLVVLNTSDHGRSKYLRTIKDINSNVFVTVDVYSVLEAFGVTCPARQHLIKKILCTGIRGKGDSLQDLKEAQVALERAIKLEEQRHG